MCQYLLQVVSRDYLLNIVKLQVEIIFAFSCLHPPLRYVFFFFSPICDWTTVRSQSSGRCPISSEKLISRGIKQTILLENDPRMQNPEAGSPPSWTKLLYVITASCSCNLAPSGPHCTPVVHSTCTFLFQMCIHHRNILLCNTFKHYLRLLRKH